jgi:hypothetical protein
MRGFNLNHQMSTLVAALAVIVGFILTKRIFLVRREITSVVEWNFTLHDPLLERGIDRCNIERIKEVELSPEKFSKDYWRTKPIIIIRDKSSNLMAQLHTKKQILLDNFTHKEVRLATYESYAFKEIEGKQDLGSYLAGLTQVTNKTSGDTAFAFGADPYGLDQTYVVPQVVQALKEDLHLEWHYQTALAASGAGLAFHWHGDVFAETLQGRRRWFLYPPEISPVFNPRATSAQWFQSDYLNHDHGNNHTDDNGLLECTIQQNEALYVPADWFHSTLSLGEAVSLTTSFANTLRKDLRYRSHDESLKLDDAIKHHMLMLDSFEASDFANALKHGTELVKKRPYNFVPHGWMGVIQTLYAQEKGVSSVHVMQRLESAMQSSRRCVELNSLYAPCRVWLFRQLKALSLIYNQEKPDLASKYRMEALKHRKAAASLSNDKDDVILDPRWRPKTFGK